MIILIRLVVVIGVWGWVWRCEGVEEVGGGG